jgi:hypothetical protein
MPHRRRWIAALAIAAALFVGACGPHHVAPPALAPGAREAAYRAGLARRESLGTAVDAEVTVWLRSSRSGSWPGVTTFLALEAPDAFRLRVESMFGTGLDVGVRGDSAKGWMPARKTGLVIDATHDSLDVRDPGGLGFRAWSAAWRPPEEAWRDAAFVDSMLTVRWTELGDSLVLSVESNGLPATITWSHEGGPPAEVRYRAWMSGEETPWPSWLEFRNPGSTLTGTARVERVRFHSTTPGRMSVKLPKDVKLLDWEHFRSALARVAAP